MPKRFAPPLGGAFIALLLTFIGISTIAQKVITGKVLGLESKPIIGASVAVKGTAIGTSTDNNGAYSITVPQNKNIIVISSVGYQSKEFNIANQTTLNANLEVATSNLDEIIVTGYTTQRKKDLTGAVAVIKTEDLTKVASASFLGQIEGRASGIQTTSSGSPGSGVSVRIRGNSTFTEGGGDPLLIIDGLQVRGTFQNQINPNDIESIQVLKDAATTASYGIGANNGVIIITTKKGKAGGAPKVSLSSYVGFQTAAKTYEDQLLKTSQEYADLVFQSYNNPGLWPQPTNSNTARTYGVGPAPVLPQYVNPLPALAGGTINTTYSYPDNLVMRASPGTNWWDAIFKTNAPITEQNISVAGGGTGGRYFFSANYFNQEGIMRYTDYNKYSLRGNTEFKVKGFTLGENFTVVFDNGVTQPNGNQVEQNSLTEGLLKMQPIIPVYDESGREDRFGGTKAGFGNGKNGLAKLYRNKDNRGEGMRLFGNVFAELRFLNHFTGRIMYGLDHGWNFGNAYTFSDPESNEVSGSGFTEFTNRYVNWIFQQQINYDNKLGDHDIKLTGVHEARLNKFRNFNAGLNGYLIENQSLWYINTAFGDPATRNVNTSGGTNNAKESYLGRVEYGFRGKYLVNGTIRYDQSSNFADKKGEVFGGVGVAWRLSDEGFLDNSSWINDLKLRGAFGVTGNDAIDPGSNYSFFGGGPGRTFYAIDGSNTSVSTGYTLTSAGHPVLWEKQQQVNVGIDAVILDHRLDISIDAYNRSNKDFLFQPGQPATFGSFGNAIALPYENIGKISNKGIEIALNWKDNISVDWGYNVGVNLTFNKNRIDKLAPELGVTSFFPSIVESRIGPLVRNYEGESMATFYGYTVDGIFQDQNEVNNSPAQDGKAVGRFRWKDINGDKVIDNNDKGIIGNPNPNLVYGVNLGLTYKGFEFTMFVQGSLGNKNFNYTKYFTDFFGFNGNRSNRMLYQSWTPTRTDAILPKLDITDNYSFQPSTYYVESASYLRAKVVQLGYTIPAGLLSRLKIESARVYIQGQNLFTITNYQGLDPTLGSRGSGGRGTENPQTEQWIGLDYGNYPTARVFMIGLNLSF